MIKNKFGTYVIENCLELINKINEEFLENSKQKEDDSNSSRSDNDDNMSYEDFIQFKIYNCFIITINILYLTK